MNPEDKVGVAATVEGVVMQINRLPRVGGHANGPGARMDGGGVRQINHGPAPVLPAVDQRIGVNLLVGLRQRRWRQSQRAAQQPPTQPKTKSSHRTVHSLLLCQKGCAAANPLITEKPSSGFL